MSTYVRPGRSAGSYVFSSLACLVVVWAFMLSDEDCQHWFVVPVFLCGVLVCVDAIDWLRGKVDVLDPKGVLGIFGIHFFFIAPLLHVRLNMWMWDVDPTPDWRPWLGEMAFLNFCGLLIYRYIVWRMSESSTAAGRPARTWKPQTRTLMTLLLTAIISGTAIQCLIYRAFGGIGGFISAVQDRHFSFLGDTWAMMLAGRVPYLVIIAIAVYWRSRNYVPSLVVLAAAVLAFTVLQILFGGLRGERSDIIYALFLAVGVLHYWIRPLTKTMVFAGLGFLVVFMYVYGFYKFGGSDGLKAMTQGADQRAAMEEDFHHSFTASLLGDLGRADMQAYVLYRLSRPENDFSFALGRTYFGSAITVLPGPVWRDRPPSKVKEVWDILYGVRTYRARIRSNRVLGSHHHDAHLRPGRRDDGKLRSLFGPVRLLPPRGLRWLEPAPHFRMATVGRQSSAPCSPADDDLPDRSSGRLGQRDLLLPDESAPCRSPSSFSDPNAAPWSPS